MKSLPIGVTDCLRLEWSDKMRNGSNLIEICSSPLSSYNESLLSWVNAHAKRSIAKWCFTFFFSCFRFDSYASWMQDWVCTQWNIAKVEAHIDRNDLQNGGRLMQWIAINSWKLSPALTMKAIQMENDGRSFMWKWSGKKPLRMWC